jgi:hypothetical protein
MKVPTQPDNERRKRVLDSLPPGAPAPEMDADGNIVGTEDYGGAPLRPEIDANGNIVGTGGPVGKFPPSARKSIAELSEWLKNWKFNDLVPRLFGMARGARRRSDQKEQISWVNRYVQNIIDIFPAFRGRPQQYEDNAARQREFQKRKKEAKSTEKLMQEIIKAYDGNRDSRGRSRREIRSGGRGAMELQQKESSEAAIGNPDQFLRPTLGGSFSYDPLVVGSRRRKNQRHKIKTDYQTKERTGGSESESKFVRNQNWSWSRQHKLTKEEKEKCVVECIEELADNNTFQVLWCPWPQELDHGLIYAPDNSGELIPREDEEFGLQVALRCLLSMPDGEQCDFCTDSDPEFDRPGDDAWREAAEWQRDQIRDHIERDHQNEWRDLLKSKLVTGGKVETCADEHERLRLQIILCIESAPDPKNTGRSRLRCDYCGKLVYDPARNHPDLAVRREYEGR